MLTYPLEDCPRTNRNNVAPNGYDAIACSTAGWFRQAALEEKISSRPLVEGPILTNGSRVPGVLPAGLDVEI